MKEISTLDISELRWVLVIEKEVCKLRKISTVVLTLRESKATFRSLAASAFWKTSTDEKGLLLTVSMFPMPLERNLEGY